MPHEYPFNHEATPEQSHTKCEAKTEEPPFYTKLCKPGDLVRQHPNLFTDGQLEWLLKTRKKNGLDDSGAILKVSGKLYINVPLFFDWFLTQKAS